MNDLLIWILLGIVIILIFLSYIISSFGLMFLFGAPYVASRKKVIREMLKCAGASSKHKVLDIGSGMGNILFIATKEFNVNYAYGIEMHPVLCLITKLKARMYKIDNKIEVIRGNFYKKPFPDVDIVTLYLLNETLDKLLPKMRKELKPGTLIVSNGFSFDGLKPIKEEKTKYGRVLLYKI